MSTGIFILYLSLIFLIGVALGALGFGLFNANFTRSLKVKNQLTETELELTKVKDTLADNLIRTAKAVDIMQSQLNNLEQRLEEDKKIFLDEKEVAFYKLEVQANLVQEFEIPKDYSEKSE